MSERCRDLVDRLRGIYTIPVNDGAGLLNGKDTFTQEFPVTPISREAADEIERLRAQRDAWRKACRFFYDTVGEGSRKGRPIDAFDKSTWHRIVELIGEADRLEATK